LFFSLFLSFYFFWYRGLNLGPHGLQVLYHQNHTLQSFLFLYIFFQIGSHVFFFWARLEKWYSYLLVCLSVVGSTDMLHNIHLVCWDRDIANFLPRLASSQDSPDFCLPSTGIIGMCHYANHPHPCFLTGRIYGSLVEDWEYLLFYMTTNQLASVVDSPFSTYNSVLGNIYSLFCSMDRWRNFLTSSVGRSLFKEYIQNKWLPDIFFHLGIFAKLALI
jgi:hypothetical protein